MKKIIIIIATLFLLNGCIHKTTKINATHQNALQGKTISLVPLDTLTYPTNANSGGLFIDTMLLSSVMKIVSNTLTTSPQYLYPTGILGSKTTNTLVKKYNMTVKPLGQPTDYQVEVKTYWYYRGVPLTWQKAQVFMENDIRLKETKTKTVIAQAFCQYNPMEVKDIPMYSYDEIDNPNSKAVKAEAKKAIDLCIKKLKNEVLK